MYLVWGQERRKEDVKGGHLTDNYYLFLLPLNSFSNLNDFNLEGFAVYLLFLAYFKSNCMSWRQTFCKGLGERPDKHSFKAGNAWHMHLYKPINLLFSYFISVMWLHASVVVKVILSKSWSMSSVMGW